MMQLRDKLENAMILNKHDSSMYLAFEITINVINNEMLETEKNQLETAYWAGRLIGYDQSWEVAEEVVDAIKLIRNEAIASHVARIKELEEKLSKADVTGMYDVECICSVFGEFKHCKSCYPITNK